MFSGFVRNKAYATESPSLKNKSKNNSFSPRYTGAYGVDIDMSLSILVFLDIPASKLTRPPWLWPTKLSSISSYFLISSIM